MQPNLSVNIEWGQMYVNFKYITSMIFGGGVIQCLLSCP